jgi:acyl-CoA thioester hydrolase
MRHRIMRGDVLCATLDLDGAWLDLRRRRIVQPPQQLIEKFEALERTEDFQVISARKKGCPDR